MYYRLSFPFVSALFSFPVTHFKFISSCSPLFTLNVFTSDVLILSRLASHVWCVDVRVLYSVCAPRCVHLGPALGYSLTHRTIANNPTHYPNHYLVSFEKNLTHRKSFSRLWDSYQRCKEFERRRYLKKSRNSERLSE